MEAEPAFAIFRGTSEQDGEWIGTVTGLLSALHRIEKIAAANPGRYFLFDSRNRSAIVKIDSRKSLLRSEQQTEKRRMG